jgi:hypothetical protein
MVSELRKHLTARILAPGPVQCRKSGPGRYRGHEYASDLRVYHEVELRRFELRTSCMPCKSSILPASGITGHYLLI